MNFRSAVCLASKVAQRREARIASIVEAAWSLAHEQGIQVFSLRDLAAEVGVQQPSLYTYFDSKNALYDAMFADGNQQLLETLDSVDLPDDAEAALKVCLGVVADFAVEDPERYSLMFSRVIPGFEPSAESYAVAQEVLGHVVVAANAAGVTNRGDIDCLVAVTAGLIDSQMSNEPGGDRWLQHLDRMIDLLVDDATTRSTR